MYPDVFGHILIEVFASRFFSVKNLSILYFTFHSKSCSSCLAVCIACLFIVPTLVRFKVPPVTRRHFPIILIFMCDFEARWCCCILDFIDREESVDDSDDSQHTANQQCPVCHLVVEVFLNNSHDAVSCMRENGICAVQSSTPNSHLTQFVASKHEFKPAAGVYTSTNNLQAKTQHSAHTQFSDVLTS